MPSIRSVLIVSVRFDFIGENLFEQGSKDGFVHGILAFVVVAEVPFEVIITLHLHDRAQSVRPEKDIHVDASQ